MTASPPKIKAYLATIKERYLDSGDESTTTTTTKVSLSLSDRFIGILKVELVLRGIVLSDDSKLWSQVQSSVGKNLVEDLPKPLLAGVNVMAGRVAEAFCNHWNASSENDRSASVLFSQEDAAGSLQRAKDIEDERWLILLRPEYHNATAMLQVAQGYFTTAAQIQSDTPPMWKKVWDTWTALRDLSRTTATTKDDVSSASSIPPFEAQVAIENQSRIALSKDNTKRSNELQLRVAQSCLNSHRIDLSIISFSANRKVTLTKTILECFGDTLTGKLESNQLKRAEKAVKALETCRSYFVQQQQNEALTPEALLFQATDVQAFMEQEEAQILSDAEELHQATQNRSLGKPSTTLAQCIKKCRESTVVSTNKDAEVPFEKCSFLLPATKLRDVLLSFWGTVVDDPPEDDLETQKTACFSCLANALNRLNDDAQILSRKTGSYHKPWNVVLHFLLPIMEEMKRQCEAPSQDHDRDSKTNVTSWLVHELGGGSFDESPRTFAKLSMISKVVTMLPEIYWMMLGDEKEPPTPLDSIMSFTIDICSALLELQKTLDKNKNREGEGPSMVTKTRDPGVVRLQMWNHAKDVATCFVCQDDEDLVSQLTSIALQTKRDLTPPLGFLRCMVSWSGWYRHPWPYCMNLSETRRILSYSRSDQGRPLTQTEEALLEIASADAELLNGGFWVTAYRQYERTLEKLKKMKSSGENEYILAILQTHCYSGMSRVVQMKEGFDEDNVVYTHGEKSLTMLGSIDVVPLQHYIWHYPQTFTRAKAYQLSVVRQLMAEALMDQGLIVDARSFLEAAVRDSPNDAEAALSYGAFLLRVAFFVSKEKSQEELKAAQVQLLKAAKLDPTKADPFALLGVWFEKQGDNPRALGCFRKSLALDPCNPVAGRGLLRQKGRESENESLEIATDINFPSNGWAWYAIGLNKAFMETNDELAVIAILKGLRCRDIAHPASEKFGDFLHGCAINPMHREEASALADVASCYRRLGRYTASIRSFHAAIASAGPNVSASVLISCARVELELGLFDDAAKKFSDALKNGDDVIARHGLATSLFSMAQREFIDGKIGGSFSMLKNALDCCLKSPLEFACQFKLLGDLYSYAATFPPHIFTIEDSTDGKLIGGQNQIDFVSKGEDAYRRCIDTSMIAKLSENEQKVVKSSYMCDVATSILLQAQLLSSLKGFNCGLDAATDREVDDMYERASKAFRDAIDQNPSFAASWCGLGCSVVRTDPLLAQHAFCRATELDKMAPEAYANLGFLYTSKFALDPSRHTMEVLTEVADTPMMWLNCAFILEREAVMHVKDEDNNVDTMLGQAADAYRAALQVARHPVAQLGLSMTSRVNESSKNEEERLALKISRRKDSLSLLKECSLASMPEEGQTTVFEAMMTMEKANDSHSNSSWKLEAYENGQTMLKKALSGKVSDLDMSSLQDVALTAEAQSLQVNRASPSELADSRDGDTTQPESPESILSQATARIREENLVAALEAAGKATVMLSEQLHNPRMSFSVHASIVSEAIALHTWLKELTNNVEIAETDDTNDQPPSFLLQRALLMDPENVIARQGLGG